MKDPRYQFPGDPTWPTYPPAGYRGQRVGDTFDVPGIGKVVVVALLPNPKHWCGRGWACKGAWQVLSRQFPAHDRN